MRTSRMPGMISNLKTPGIPRKSAISHQHVLSALRPVPKRCNTWSCDKRQRGFGPNPNVSISDTTQTCHSIP